MNKPKPNFIFGKVSVRNGADLAYAVACLIEKMNEDPNNVCCFIQGVANGFGIAASMLGDGNCPKEKAVTILTDAKNLIMDSLAKSLREKGGES